MGNPCKRQARTCTDRLRHASPLSAVIPPPLEVFAVPVEPHRLWTDPEGVEWRLRVSETGRVDPRSRVPLSVLEFTETSTIYPRRIVAGWKADWSLDALSPDEIRDIWASRVGT